MKCIKELTKKEMKEINGGWIYDLFFAIGAGAVIQARKSVDKDRATVTWMDKF